MSSVERNKQLARLWLDLVNALRIEELCAITAPTWTMTGGPPNLPAGPAGIRALFEAIGPISQQWTIEDMVAEGDKVVIRATNTCEQDSFHGIPAKGQRQTFSAMFMHQIVDGQVVRTWRNADDLGRVMQLGAKLTPGEAR
jgi:hypothetical protein